MLDTDDDTVECLSILLAKLVLQFDVFHIELSKQLVRLLRLILTKSIDHP